MLALVCYAAGVASLVPESVGLRAQADNIILGISQGLGLERQETETSFLSLEKYFVFSNRSCSKRSILLTL